MINYTKNEPYNQTPYYACFAFGGKHIGNIINEVDGFYYFYPKDNGFLTQEMALDLGHKLESLNEAWSQKLKGLNVHE